MYLYIHKIIKCIPSALFLIIQSQPALAESSFEAAKQSSFFYYQEAPNSKPEPKKYSDKQNQSDQQNQYSSNTPLQASPTIVVGNIKVLTQKQGNQASGITKSAVEEANYKLEVGDFVLRQNNSMESKIIREIDGTPYSHIAIVTQSVPAIYVTHAASDDVPSAKYQVIKQKLSDYLSPKLATHFAAYRPTFLTFSDKTLIASYMEKQIGKPFILNSREKPHRYCSSLIYDAVRTRTDQYNPIWKNIKYKHYRGLFLTPSSMITNGQFKKIIDSRNRFR